MISGPIWFPDGRPSLPASSLWRGFLVCWYPRCPRYDRHYHHHLEEDYMEDNDDHQDLKDDHMDNNDDEHHRNHDLKDNHMDDNDNMPTVQEFFGAFGMYLLILPT